MNFYDINGDWQKYLRSWNLSVADNSIRDKSVPSKKVPLASFLVLIVETLNCLAKVQVTGCLLTSRQYRLKIDMMHALGSLLLFHEVTSRSILIILIMHFFFIYIKKKKKTTNVRVGQAGAIEALQNVIRCPAFLSVAAKTNTAIPSDVLQNELMSQLTAWHVLRFAVQVDPTNVKFMLGKANSVLNPFECLVDLFLWVSRVSASSFASTPETYAGLDEFPVCSSILSNPTAMDTPQLTPTPDGERRSEHIPTAVAGAPLVQLLQMNEESFGALGIPNMRGPSKVLPAFDVSDETICWREIDILFRMAYMCCLSNCNSTLTSINIATGAPGTSSTGGIGSSSTVQPPQQPTIRTISGQESLSTFVVPTIMAIFLDEIRPNPENQLARSQMLQKPFGGLQLVFLHFMHDAIWRQELFALTLLKDPSFVDLLFKAYMFQVESSEGTVAAKMRSVVFSFIVMSSTIKPDGRFLIGLDKLADLLVAHQGNVVLVAEVRETQKYTFYGVIFFSFQSGVRVPPGNPPVQLRRDAKAHARRPLDTVHSADEDRQQASSDALPV